MGNISLLENRHQNLTPMRSPSGTLSKWTAAWARTLIPGKGLYWNPGEVKEEIWVWAFYFLEWFGEIKIKNIQTPCLNMMSEDPNSALFEVNESCEQRETGMLVPCLTSAMGNARVYWKKRKQNLMPSQLLAKLCKQKRNTFQFYAEIPYWRWPHDWTLQIKDQAGFHRGFKARGTISPHSSPSKRQLLCPPPSFLPRHIP